MCIYQKPAADIKQRNQFPLKPRSSLECASLVWESDSPVTGSHRGLAVPLLDSGGKGGAVRRPLGFRIDSVGRAEGTCARATMHVSQTQEPGSETAFLSRHVVEAVMASTVLGEHF